jgi:type IV pilus assembly protein PilY1
MGYTISGTTHDGTYMDQGHYGGIDYLATPATCNWPQGYGVDSATDNGTGCGIAFSPSNQWKVENDEKYASTRTFEFSNSTSKEGNYLENPLYMAAKYGGFKDTNLNGVPDLGEWEGADGNPRNYFQASNITELPLKLESAFRDIAKTVSTGTATSASINSVLNGGISIQTAFYPTYVSPGNPNLSANWVGTVYALFVDKYGNLRENNGDDLNYLGQTNTVVTFNSVSMPPEPEPDCYVSGVPISRCTLKYNGEVDTTLAPPASIHAIAPIWNVGEVLSNTDPDTRKLYYVSPNTLTATLFSYDPASVNILKDYMLHDNYKTILYDSSSTKTKVAATTELIRYIRGEDIEGFRNRTVENPWGNDPPRITWRLGDIINSKPVIVGQPAFNYNFLYNDSSYSAFRTNNATRRQVAYFGSNDGFLHAINMGKFGSLGSGQVGYDPDGYPLGSELWGLIPDSALPHLQWLADREYAHSYYVDMKPLIADVKASVGFFKGQWRTILICGLRLGGRPIEAPTSTPSNPKNFYSEVIALDVTDPDPTKPPTILWRFSTEKLGLSVGLPAVVTSQGNWYAVLASGPAMDFADSTGKIVFSANPSPYEGNSSQNAKLFVLDAYSGALVRTIESPVDESFFNEPYVPLPLKSNRDGTWNDEVIYYGMTITRDQACLDKGGVYRLQMVAAADNDPVTPDGAPLGVAQWTLKPFIDVDRPVTGAVNSAFDYQGNLWVTFGTGRMWSEQDFNPCFKADTDVCRENHQQYIFGVKEPLINGRMTFGTVSVAGLIDVSDATVFTSKVVTGIPDITNYPALTAAMSLPTTPGYKRRLNLSSLLKGRDLNEISLTQPQITSIGVGKSVLAFTSYAPPKGDGCGETGEGFMYVVDPFTGLAAPYLSSMFKLISVSDPGNDGNDSPPDMIISGGVSTGSGQPSGVVLSHTDDALIVRTTTTENATIDGKIRTEKSVTNSIISWREVFNTGFQLPKSIMGKGLVVQ